MKKKRKKRMRMRMNKNKREGLNLINQQNKSFGVNLGVYCLLITSMHRV